MVSKILFLIELISDLSAMAPSCHHCPQDMPLDSIRAMIVGPRGTLVTLNLSRNAREFTV
jgi:hypothetical protein